MNINAALQSLVSQLRNHNPRSTVGQAPKPLTVCNPCCQDVRGRKVEAIMRRYKTIIWFFIKERGLMILFIDSILN
jgi:hypothetical protein